MLVAVAVFFVLAGLLLAILTRPDTFRIARTVTVAAPASLVFAQLDDPRLWRGWSPFETLDPDLKRSYSGAPAGVGAVYEFEGRKAGAGRMTITGSYPTRRVVVRAEFLRPLRATNRIDFTIFPAAEGVGVTWAMSGRQTFAGKAISLLVSMDRLVGGDFEKGLVQLKELTEAQARADGASKAS